MQIAENPPVEFEKIVREITEHLLSQYEFTVKEQIKFYQNAHVDFSRNRKNIRETIRICRRRYYEGDKDKELEKDVEKPLFDKDYGTFWDSRHWFEILLIVNYSHRNLLTTGEAGIGRNGEECWYFEDEEDLRELLAEKIVPLLQTVAMKDFDERLKDKLEYLAKYPEAKQHINNLTQTNDGV